MNNTLTPKLEAALRLATALVDDLDFEVWLDSHPNEEKALDRLQEDVNAADPD